MSEEEKRKQLQREITAIKVERELLRSEQRANPNGQTETPLRQLRPRLSLAERNLEQFHSRVLLKEARRRRIPISKEPDWWSDDRADFEGYGRDQQVIDDMTSTWLSDIGRAMVVRLISDDRKKNIEWWIKIVTPLLAAIISLMGLIVALVTVSRSR